MSHLQCLRVEKGGTELGFTGLWGDGRGLALPGPSL